MEKNKVNKVELVYITPNAAQKIESIACVCYDSEPTEDCKIFKGCMKSGHMSVAEHSDITFKVTCSRACSHQLVRHRTGKFTQRSQRYCKEDNFEYYIPDSIKNDESALKIYKMAMGAIFITWDFRNFFHFLNERLCTRAQKEIRDIAKEMARLAVEACPIIKPYCVPKCESFSIAYCPEHKGCGRHKPLKEIVRDEYKSNL